MPTVNFYLKNYIDTDGASLLYVQVTYQGKRLRLSTMHRVFPRDWDLKKQRMKGYTPESRQFNNLLQYIEDKMQSVFIALQTSGNMNPSVIDFRRAFDAATTEKKSDIRDIFEIYAKERSSVLSTRQVTQHRRALHDLLDYGASQGIDVQLNSLTESLYTGFVGWFASRGALNNYIGQYVKHIVTFAHWCERKGYVVHPEIKTWKKLKESVQIITLTADEVAKIESLDLSARPFLDKTRTLFLLECYSGLRWSDASKVTASAVHDGYLHIDVQKTAQPLRIPITAPLKAIVDRIVSNPQRVISPQKFNTYVKILCKAAGIDAVVKRVRHSGTRRFTTELPKWRYVTSHTGRRTFVTLSLEKGMRPEVVMKITGHKDIQTMMRYVNILAGTAKDEMREAWG